MTRLKEHYQQAVKSKLKEQFGYQNDMAIPRLEKIVVNIGMGREAVTDARRIQAAVKELSLITGQRPVTTKSRKSIASFKTREGMPLGVKVTLRSARMYEFLDRLVNIAMPRIRDFRGINPKSFDGRGNYTLGVKEQIIFPEIEYDKVDRIRGLGITIVMSAKNDIEAKALLEKFNFPFRKS
jgi:large subunit ribosomal protein L5